MISDITDCYTGQQTVLRCISHCRRSLVALNCVVTLQLPYPVIVPTFCLLICYGPTRRLGLHYSAIDSH